MAAWLVAMCSGFEVIGQPNTNADAAPVAIDSFEAQLLASLPVYQPGQPVSGTIRVWGHGNVKIPWMRQLMMFWEDGFRRYHPGVKVQYEMHGTSSAIPSLFMGLGDLSILGEEIDPAAVAVFEKVKHHPPVGIEIMTGSLDVRNFDFAQTIFVHKDNPVSRLTLAQLDAIFGTEHRRGLSNIRKWGQLGLTGEWADKPINPYGWSYDNDYWNLYLQDAIFNGSHRWNSDLKGFAHIYNSDGTIYDAGQQILEALTTDRYGIAISNLRYMSPQMHVKPLAIATGDGGPYYLPTKENLILRKYPLTRIIPVVIDRQPGMPIDPKVKEFLRYILSREGQESVVKDGRYLPLNKEAIALQLKKLE